ncbi:VCBS repeat-containing protein [Candidatus Poribacteria bacterium]|nr:VCBS repeat-containing protein [Candidatus Poribacteria bacterium]
MRYDLMAVMLMLGWMSVVRGVPEEITKLKPLYPETPLIVDGKAVSVIVSPRNTYIQKEARRLRNRLKDVTGAVPELIDVDEVISEDWEIRFDYIGKRNLIALGNINDNRLLAALWGEGYVVADSVYPYKGGYVIRTVHDPFGRGINVVVLAGSDVEGVRRAVDVFCERYLPERSRTVVLTQPIVDVKFTPIDLPFLPAPAKPGWAKRQPQYRTAEFYRRQLTDENGRIRHIEKGNVLNLLGPIAGMAQTWFWTGDPDLPPLMKAFFDRNRHLLKVGLERVEMEPGTAEMLRWWDIVEELPVWTDGDRLEITNAFLRDSRLGHERRAVHRLVKGGYVQVVDENHGTFAAWRDFQAWRYFDKYYHLPEAKYWMDVARAIYAGQCSTHQILEDAAGYMCYCPDTTISYAFASRDLRYLESGIAKDHAEYIAQVAVNNLGLSTGFGDSPSLMLPAAYQVIEKAAWYYRDPRLSWIIQHHMPRATSLRAFQIALPYDLTVQAREPVKWAGLRLFPIYKMPPTGRAPLKGYVFAPREPAGPQWFNKIVFREAWRPDAQYLLLDTAGRWIKPTDKVYPPGPAGHKHDDVNTIINLTDKGRMWLVDHTYGLRSIKDHSGLYITRDGEVSYRCHEARVLDHAESGDLAFVRSLYEDFSGSDWERSIFWLKGKHFVVIDRVRAKEPGVFTVRCSFRALGEEELRETRMRLTQEGKYCDIVSDGEALLDVERLAYDNPDEWRRWYPYAEPVVKILQEDKAKRLRRGESLWFHNMLIASDSKDELDRLDLLVASDGCAMVFDRLKDKPIGLYGMGDPPGEVAEAHLFAATLDQILLSGATLLGTSENMILRADQPVILFLSTRGDCVIENDEPTIVQIVGRKESIRLEPGRHELRWEGANRTAELLSKLFDAAEQKAAERRCAGVRPIATTIAPTSPTIRARTVRVPGTIADIAVADLDGDGRDEWIVAGDKGVSALRPDGSLLWRFPMKRSGSALEVGDVDGDGCPEIAVGCEDHRLYLLDAVGGKRWDFTCKPSENKAGPPVPDFVRIVDLDSDGAKEIVAGANWVHCLDANGKLKWEDYLIYARGHISGDFRCGAIADFDGDGRRELLALFYYTYHVGMIFGSDGRVIYPPNRDRRKKDGLYKLPLPQCVVATNLLGGPGTPHFVVGADSSMRTYWAMGEYAGEVANGVAGDFRALALYHPESGAPIIFGGTDTGRIIAVQAEGLRKGPTIRLRTVWNLLLGQKITTLWVGRLGSSGRPLLLVGTKPGAAFVFDAETGKPIGHIPPSDSPVVKFLRFQDGLLIAYQAGIVRFYEVKP